MSFTEKSGGMKGRSYWIQCRIMVEVCLFVCICILLFELWESQQNPTEVDLNGGVACKPVLGQKFLKVCSSLPSGNNNVSIQTICDGFLNRKKSLLIFHFTAWVGCTSVYTDDRFTRYFTITIFLTARWHLMAGKLSTPHGRMKKVTMLPRALASPPAGPFVIYVSSLFYAQQMGFF